tara:strand:- start:764 stop:1642 length:879 start_codon:yes stop_codon:yes gene_type:complete
MELIEQSPLMKSFFIFDLEFIGDVRNLSTCRIWEIAVFSLQTNQWFECIIDPDPTMQIFPPPPIPEIPELKREFLKENNAEIWANNCVALETWISNNSLGGVPVFISHNTFRADKPILELEFKRAARTMPLDWYFFDSLHFSRRMVKNSTGNYSLSGLHQQLFGEPILNAHRAKADVIACMRIMSSITNGVWDIRGPMYPSYSTALRTIRWIGQKAENILYNENIRSVEGLYTLLVTNARIDKIHSRLSFQQSVLKSLQTIITHQLPMDNIKNIANVISSGSVPICFTFMHR